MIKRIIYLLNQGVNHENIFFHNHYFASLFDSFQIGVRFGSQTL